MLFSPLPYSNPILQTSTYNTIDWEAKYTTNTYTDNSRGVNCWQKRDPSEGSTLETPMWIPKSCQSQNGGHSMSSILHPYQDNLHLPSFLITGLMHQRFRFTPPGQAHWVMLVWNVFLMSAGSTRTSAQYIIMPVVIPIWFVSNKGIMMETNEIL